MTMVNPKSIQPAEMRAALLRSGYLLESRLESLLRNRDQGYGVQANAPYADPDTGKSRELDIHAMTAWKAGPAEFDFLFAALVIECVNNPQPLALITKEPMLQDLHAEHVRLAGIPTMIPERGNTWSSLADYLRMEKYHHYCQGRIATQYCTFERKKQGGDWMAFHEDQHFSALRSLTDEVDFLIRQYYEGWRAGDGEESVNLEFYFPILVVTGELLEIMPTTRGFRSARRGHLKLQRSVIRGQETEEYQIDVVTEKAFPQLLDLIEAEMAKTARLMRRRPAQVRDAIDQLAARVRRARSTKKIREALEF
jgi:hypothetical protein